MEDIPSATKHAARPETRLLHEMPAAFFGPLLVAMANCRPKPTIMINGLSGAMGTAVALAAHSRDLDIFPLALASNRHTNQQSLDLELQNGITQTVKLYPHSEKLKLAQIIQEQFTEPGSLICIDYTHPSAVNENAEWYAEHNIPFVMGTTGGDREALMHTVSAGAGTYCVIAPNMAKQIVAIQSAVEKLASEFPGAFAGYSLRVVESHQSTKADTSGTAKVSFVVDGIPLPKVSFVTET